MWFTGNSIYEIDILAPIKYCERMGYKEDEIVMDVILSGNPNLPHALANYYNSFGMLERTLEV